MQLPAPVRDAIERRAAAIPFPALKRAAALLSDAYRDTRNARAVRLPPAERAAAYLVARMPATYAAASAVFAQLGAVIDPAAVTTLLDVGAGTGAAALAAREAFPNLAHMTLLEPDAAFAEAGREWLPEAAWESADFRSPGTFPEHDIVVAGYSLGEVAQPEALEAAARMYAAARLAFVLIEPGSSSGFALVRAVRARLLEAGAAMLAPCPAAGPCPMRDPDWCDFACRVERTALHRRVKEAALNYEDEKFSYVALGKQPAALPQGRIIRRPQYTPGLIQLEVCRGDRIETVRTARRDRETYRAARKAAWGDPWPPPR